MNPDKEQLLALILRQTAGTPAPLPKSMREKESPFPLFNAWLAALTPLLPAGTEAELADYQYCALMGVVVGFCDRNLSPFLENHTAIIPPLLDDIASVYAQVKDTGAAYSHENFTYRAYDYGIHKAYYLDWDLYMSHEMY